MFTFEWLTFGTHFGFHFWHLFGAHLTHTLPLCKVKQFWNHCFWISSTAPDPTKLLYVNFDETSVQYQVANKRANWSSCTSVCFGDVPSRRRDCFSSVPNKDTRSNTTLVAFICSDGELQKYMPQVFLPKPHIDAATRAAMDALEPPLKCIKTAKGWNGKFVMPQLYKHLHTAVQSHCPDRSVVIVQDVCPSHLTMPGLNLLKRYGWGLILVPSKMTPELQPLDSHVMKTLKQKLFEEQTKERMTSTTKGIMLPGKWVSAADRAVRRTLVERNWDYTFKVNGIIPHSDLPPRRKLLDIANFDGDYVQIAQPVEEADFKKYTGMKYIEYAKSMNKKGKVALHSTARPKAPARPRSAPAPSHPTERRAAFKRCVTFFGLDEVPHLSRSASAPFLSRATSSTEPFKGSHT
jgi:hypothetical protein